MDLFSRSLTALCTAVDAVTDEDFARPCGCAGWRVRDLVCHLVIGAQDVLITLVTPAAGEPTVDAAGYWTPGVEPAVGEPSGAEPPAELVPRLAAAYGEARWLRFHFEDVGPAAGRAARLADPALRVSTRDQVLTAADYLSAYVLEWTLHHLDLVTHLPGVAGPPADTLAAARGLLEEAAGIAFPASFADVDALLVGTGRRTPTAAERAALGEEAAARLPFPLG